jgi:hypothetical protein
MSDDGDLPAGELPAGNLSVWLGGMRAALRGEAAADVPCGGCTACCTASQFIHIGPDETDTLAHIPAPLLFSAPRLPRGHVLLGYDGRGHCPMLVEGRCSIYEHRPRTCRTYDCRIFTVTGLAVDDGDRGKEGIARQARRWRFSLPTPDDRRRQDAVLTAVAAATGAAGADGATTTQVAVRAIETYEEFMR